MYFIFRDFSLISGLARLHNAQLHLSNFVELLLTPVIPVVKVAALRERREDQHRTHLLTMQRMDFDLFCSNGCQWSIVLQLRVG
jgi:hypothetical protein